MFDSVSLIIGGEDRRSGSAGTVEVFDPATGETIASLPRAGAPEAAEAARVALDGFKEWSALSAFERYKILRRAAELMRAKTDEAARIMTLEQGKPVSYTHLTLPTN